jgi:putative tricarboxylic transport membrane protein
MFSMKKISAVLCAGALAVSLGACSSDAPASSAKKEGSGYPTKAITVVAPSGAGGGWDLTARSLTKGCAPKPMNIPTGFILFLA